MAYIPMTKAEPLVFAASGFEENTDSVGLAQSIVSDLARQCGTRISLSSIPYQRRNELYLSGKIDGSFSSQREYDQGGPELIRIETPVVELSIYAYSKIKNVKIEGWKSLENYKVAYNLSSKVIKNKLTSKKENTTSFTHNEAALQFLASGRADFFVGTPLFVEPLLTQDNFKSSGIEAVLPPLDVSYSYMYIHRKHAKLAACFDVVLKKSGKNRTYRNLLDEKSLAR